MLVQVFSKQVRPKNVSPKTCQEINTMKTYKCHKGPDIYLIRVGAGPVFSTQVEPKNVSPKTCQATDAIKTYKGHKVPNIYLIRVGAGPVFFKTDQAQKCFTQDLSGNQSYKNL